MDQITDLNDLRLFAEVVEHGGFTAAARSLGLQTSKLSRRVRALEEELGVRLLNRTSHSLSLTETGRQFHLHCLALVAESKAAKETAEQALATPHGTVRISCPVGLLSSAVADIVSQFVQDNPQVKVQVDATNRRVDVVEEGLDFAIRVRLPPLEDTDLALRQLGLSTFVLVASPVLASRFEVPVSVDCLKPWPTICMLSKSERYTWNFFDVQGQTFVHEHQPRLTTDDLASLRLAAIRGVGATLLPKENVEEDLQSGRLLRMLPHLNGKTGIVHAVFHSRRGMVPAVRQLLDALVSGYQTLNRN